MLTECRRRVVKEEVVRLSSILNRVLPFAQHVIDRVGKAITRWSKPISHAPVLDAVMDLARSKPQLVAENVLLRQQLIVLNRLVKRPRYTPAERGLFVFLASKLQSWKEALLIVKPETVLRWHREGFRLFWKRKSRAGPGAEDSRSDHRPDQGDGRQ